MKFDADLKEGLLLRRYKRFFADIEYQGEKLVAHVANTGSLLGVLSKDALPCRFSLSDDPNRKLKASLHMIKAGKAWVGINTQWPNRLVVEAYENKKVKNWLMYESAKPEFKISAKTRLDMALFKKPTDKKPSHYVEVKNVTYARGTKALFPDSVSERALKHVEEMCALMKAGATCELVFVVQRNDCTSFGIAEDIDPEYFKAIKKAQNAGLQISAYPVNYYEDRAELDCSQQLLLSI